MKQLTYSAMATARLRANKRQYLSLVLGIFLSVFLVSSLVLGVYGIYLSFLNDRYDKVGFVDMVVLDNSNLERKELEEMALFDQIGSVYISGVVTDRNVYVGYYDEVGQSLMNLNAIEGRLPENAGEIALEKSAMDVLEVQWTLGEIVELNITPVDGTTEKRTFTIVGFLPERTKYFEISDTDGLKQFPAIVTSVQELGFAVGRLGNHYVLKLQEAISVSDGLYEIRNRPNIGYYNTVYGLSISGEQQMFHELGNAIDANQEMFTMILMSSFLAGSLILSCGVGISGAMEGVLSRRREEIGVLRALGATRRQIRRMFGRENLILALVVSPLSIAASCLMVWILSVCLPNDLVFAFNPWLLLPIAIFSVVVVLLAGFLPLLRASKLMPMSVIRDTAMLRRNKRIKMKQTFKPTRLIASRQIRFNPTRQIGAVLLVGLMLLCSGLFSVLLANYSRTTLGDMAGFVVESTSGVKIDNRTVTYDHPSMTQQSIRQLGKLDHVRSVEVNRMMYLSAIVDKVPRYVIYDAVFGNAADMMDDAMFQEAQGIWDELHYANRRETERRQYKQFLEEYQIDGEAYPMTLVTETLDEELLDRLNENLESGKINLEAINAGREVIVMAPEVWIAPHKQGGVYYWYSEEAAHDDPNGKNAQLLTWNDTFTAGQTLPLLHLYQTEDGGQTYREDASVTIGAVISDSMHFGNSSAYILTTEQGLENLGIRAEGINRIDVYLDGEVPLEEEETLEQQITAIARRNEGYSVYNRVARYRALAQSNQQTILLLVAITIVFFAVSVGMIVSSVTRQLNSEGRTIGMLRAVGADEKAILGCYSGQLTASVVGGMGLGLGLWACLWFIECIVPMFYGTIVILSVRHLQIWLGVLLIICVMGVACFFACRFFLRLRIREIVNKSIIDNIREL